MVLNIFPFFCGGFLERVSMSKWVHDTSRLNAFKYIFLYKYKFHDILIRIYLRSEELQNENHNSTPDASLSTGLSLDPRASWPLGSSTNKAHKLGAGINLYIY